MEPTRNNRGVAHENGAIESPHGHLKRAIRDALLMRGTSTSANSAPIAASSTRSSAATMPATRKRIDAERAVLQPLPGTRTCRLRGDAGLRHLFRRLHLAQSLLHRALAADRPSAAGAAVRRPAGSLRWRHAPDDAAARRPGPDGKHGHVVDYRHVIHALRRKPMALLNLVYRNQLFPREAYRRTFDACASVCRSGGLHDSWSICSRLAHERACEADSPTMLYRGSRRNLLPDMATLRTRFAPDPARLPQVRVSAHAAQAPTKR